MAGIFSKVSAFARSPQGQKLIKQAQKAAQDPENRAKVQALATQLKTRGAAAAKNLRAEMDKGAAQSKPDAAAPGTKPGTTPDAGPSAGPKTP